MPAKKTRPIDYSAKQSLSLLGNKFVFIKKTRIKTWKAIFAVAFITGITVATFWTISFDLYDSSLAAPDPNAIKHRYIYAIHLEPQEANNEYFEKLRLFVKKAKQNNIKLTIMLTPQWVDMVMKDGTKIDRLKNWQNQGMEIAAQHHNEGHLQMADGFADLAPTEEYASIRIKSGSIYAPEPYNGTMQQYMQKYIDLSSKLPKPIIVATYGEGEDIANSVWMPPEKPFKVFLEGIYGPSTGKPVLKTTANGITVKELRMRYINSQEALRTAKDEYENMNVRKNDITTVVMHLGEVDAGWGDKWIKYLKKIDPEGKYSIAASQVL